MKDFARQLSYLLLAVFLITGFILAFLLPPFQAPDEDQHWIAAIVRAESLFQGDREVCSPALAFPEIFGVNKIAWHPEQKIFTGSFDRAALAEPRCAKAGISYGNVLTYPGVLAAKILLPGNEPKHLLIQFYLARLFHGLLVFGLLFRFRKLAFSGGNALPGALSVLGLGLSPLFAQQSFAISSDVTSNAFAISLATFLFHWKRLSRIDWFLFAALGVSACGTKPTILPVLAAVCVAIAFFHLSELKTELKAGLPQFRFKLLAGLSSILVLLGLVTVLGHSSGHHINAAPEAQRAFIHENPLAAGKAILVTVFEKSRPTPLFHPLGWMDTYLPSTGVNLWLLVLIVLFTTDLGLLFQTHSFELQLKKARLEILATAGIGSGLVVSGFLTGYFLYLVWTTVGADRVDGLQGRYFLGHVFILGASVWALADKLFVKKVGTGEPTSTRTLLRILPAAVLCLVGLVEIFSTTKSLLAVAERFW